MLGPKRHARAFDPADLHRGRPGAGVFRFSTLNCRLSTFWGTGFALREGFGVVRATAEGGTPIIEERGDFMSE